MIAESAAVFLQEKSSTAQVRKICEAEGGLDRALWQEVVDMGWCSVALPEAAGGMGLGWRELVLLQEQMGYYLACVPFFDAVVAVTPLWKALSQTEAG
ncbi:MAG: acyl-CoA dehydrogenase family protein, partial [Comamonas sp.]